MSKKSTELCMQTTWRTIWHSKIHRERDTRRSKVFELERFFGRTTCDIILIYMLKIAIYFQSIKFIESLSLIAVNLRLPNRTNLDSAHAFRRPAMKEEILMSVNKVPKNKDIAVCLMFMHRFS